MTKSKRNLRDSRPPSDDDSEENEAERGRPGTSATASTTVM
jgi:choline-phosphate cytidylyltransferase